MKIFFTLLLLFAISVSCSKNDDDDCGIPAEENSATFLENMQVGDKIYYSMAYSSPAESDYAYTGDTLELEVLETSAEGVVISQRITAGSSMMTDPDIYYWQKDSVYTNNWRIVGDSLFIDSEGPYYGTHLLANTQFKFSDYTGQAVEITGWQTTTNQGEQDALLYTTNFNLLGHNYDSLSVFVNNEPMTYDGNGSTSIYSRQHGIVRGVQYGSMVPVGHGWDRIW